MSEEKYFEEVPSYEGQPENTYEMDSTGSPQVDSTGSPRVELVKASGSVAERKTKKETESQELGEGVLTLDVYRTPTEVIVESAIAGVDPNDIDIDITPDSITIRGERRKSREIHDKDYDLQECYWGRFSRSIILPEEVDADAAKADLENGILIVRMPKRTKGQSKKLKIGSK